MVLPADELATILCGSAPLLQGEPVSVGVDDGLLLLTIAAGDTGQRIGIGEEAAIETSRVRRIVPGAGGRAEQIAPAYDLELAHFRYPGAVRFPLEIQLDAPTAKARIELAWSEVEVNAPADEALFHLEPPKGARVVDLSPGASVPEAVLPVGPAARKGE